MRTSITKEQLVNFVLNEVNKDERKKIIEAITANSEIKEKYLYEKRKHDVERYIYDEMNIGERCEIEELIKMDSRLFDHFELNNGVIKGKQNITNHKQIPISEEQLIKFVLNNVNDEERKKISEAINTNPPIKERYLYEKRKYDVERYFNNKLNIGERFEIEELLKTNSRLFEYFNLKKDFDKEKQHTSRNLMHISITKEQLVNFICNNVNDEERKKIIEAIETSSEIKEWYLFEKRKHDVERYINDEMDIGECCEIEELIKTDSRLYDHFELNTEANDEKKQDVSKKPKQKAITKEQLTKFVLNDVYDEKYIEEYTKLSEAINTNSLIKERYLFEKRKHDVERYVNGEMDFEERCEIEELLKINLSLSEYCDLKKDLNYQEQNVLINGKQIAITKEKLVNFILNDVNDEEHEMISEAINTKSIIKERFLFEKRKYDVERYIDNEMTIGERCEIEERIKTDPGLFDYFELNNGVMEEEQDVTVDLKQIAITKEQLVNFVLNNVNEKEYQRISEAINTNPATKERYLFEKRKHDVERYLDNEMEIGERCEIEELLETNPRLHAHYELNKDIIEVLEKSFKEKFNNIHDELYDTFQNNKSDRIDDEISTKETKPVIELKFNVLRVGKWVAAASIILMISTFGMNYFTSNENSLEENLYNSYYEPFRNSTNGFFNSTYMIEAKKKYNNREYDAAWVLINNLPNSMTLEAEKIFYTGLTLMELGNYKEAINKFKILQANENLIVINSLNQWYMALCYLKIEKRAEAIEILEKIVTNKNYNYSKAKKILQKLS